uniref:Uncharacterized protein n=1 Tax=Mustela putorius furo TaxID=9669 RepID=M3XT11_MUSPF
AHLQTQSWFHQQVGSCAWGCGGCSGRAAGPRRRRQGPCACHLGRSGHGQRTEGGLEQAGQVSRCCLLGLSGSPAPAGQLCAGDPGGIPGAPSAPCGGQGAPGLSAPPPAQSLCGLLGEGPAPARSVTAAGHPQAWQNLRVTEQHLTLLNEIPPSFRVLTLQHSPDRTHLYCAAYERPRPVPAAKGKLLQVGGEFCRLCRPGARGPGTRAAGGSTTHTWGPALPMLAWGC